MKSNCTRKEPVAEASHACERAPGENCMSHTTARFGPSACIEPGRFGSAGQHAMQSTLWVVWKSLQPAVPSLAWLHDADTAQRGRRQATSPERNPAGAGMPGPRLADRPRSAPQQGSRSNRPKQAEKGPRRPRPRKKSSIPRLKTMYPKHFEGSEAQYIVKPTFDWDPRLILKQITHFEGPQGSRHCKANHFEGPRIPKHCKHERSQGQKGSPRSVLRPICRFSDPSCPRTSCKLKEARPSQQGCEQGGDRSGVILSCF